MSAVCEARSFGELRIASGRKPIPARNRPSRSDCFSPFGESGRCRVGAVPLRRIAGIRMAEEVQLDDVGHVASISNGRAAQAIVVASTSVRCLRASGMNAPIRSLSWMNTRRKTARRSSSLPSASAGSS